MNASLHQSAVLMAPAFQHAGAGRVVLRHSRPGDTDLIAGILEKTEGATPAHPPRDRAAVARQVAAGAFVVATVDGAIAGFSGRFDYAGSPDPRTGKPATGWCEIISPVVMHDDSDGALRDMLNASVALDALFMIQPEKIVMRNDTGASVPAAFCAMPGDARLNAQAHETVYFFRRRDAGYTQNDTGWMALDENALPALARCIEGGMASAAFDVSTLCPVMCYRDEVTQLARVPNSDPRFTRPGMNARGVFMGLFEKNPGAENAIAAAA